MNFDDIQKKAFDFAADQTKQLMTLATGLLAFTVAFVKDGGDPGDPIHKYMLITSWGLLIISIGCGTLTLMALTGNLDPLPSKVIDGVSPPIKPYPILTITTSNVTGTARLQVYSFLLGVLFTVIAGSYILFHNAPTKEVVKVVFVHGKKDTLIVSSPGTK